MRLLFRFASLALLPLSLSAQVRSTGFIADSPPTLSSHASTIVDAKNGLVSAWFGGSKERARDCVIWVSRQIAGSWNTPVAVAVGNEDSREQWACWNPVLFEKKDGPLYLFYKVGPNPAEWWGRVMSSDDGGRTWSRSRRLPANIIGPVRNKPVELANGTILCGASTENAGWRVHMEWTKNPFGSWERTEAIHSALDWGAIQPTILPWTGRGVQILCRSRQRVIVESWSTTDLKVWSKPRRTGFPNPNSSMDAVVLKSGQALLVYNPTSDSRRELEIASSPNGREWTKVLTLENAPGEYSYPAIVEDRQGLVHVTYTWKREKIKHVVLDPTLLRPQ